MKEVKERERNTDKKIGAQNKVAQKRSLKTRQEEKIFSINTVKTNERTGKKNPFHRRS